MGGRRTDEEWHALLEPLRHSFPTEQAELLSLQHMDVFVLDDVCDPRFRRKDDAPIENGGPTLHTATK